MKRKFNTLKLSSSPAVGALPSPSGFPFLGKRNMKVIMALNRAADIRLRVFASLLVPVHVDLASQYTGLNKWPNVHADAVVQVRVPAHRQLMNGFPADENVMGQFTQPDEFQIALQLLSGS